MQSSTAASLFVDAPLPRGVEEELAGPPRELGPVSRPERISSLDVLRGFALLGILMANIEDFSGPQSLHFIPVGVGKPAFVGPHAHLNLIVLLLKLVFLNEFSTRGLFCMLFGAGVILFAGRPDRAGSGSQKSTDLFHRRNMWLMVLGALHGTLIWSGDILLEYGMVALLALYPLRRLKPRTLLIAATMIWTAYMGSLLYHYHGFDVLAASRKMNIVAADQRAGKPLTAEEKSTQALWQKIKAPMHTWERSPAPLSIDAADVQDDIKSETSGYLAFVQNEGTGYLNRAFRRTALGGCLDALAAMLIGMALLKNGFLSAELPFSTYLLTAVAGYLISIPLTIFTLLKAYAAGFSVLAMNQWVYSQLFVSAEAGLLAFAATLLIMYKSGFVRPLMRPFAAVGQTALSNYLLTSILCQWIFRFGPWKLYGQLEYFQAVFVVFAVWAINLIVSPLWLLAFEFGPFEWLWRSLTYWKLQPLRRTI